MAWLVDVKLHYTMPYKFDPKYQHQRKYKTAEAQEFTFVSTGKRSRAVSLIYALGHFAKYPWFAFRSGVQHRFNAEWRFQVVRHAYGIVGRLRGSLRACVQPRPKPGPENALATERPRRVAKPSD